MYLYLSSLFNRPVNSLSTCPCAPLHSTMQPSDDADEVICDSSFFVLTTRENVFKVL